jgi:hypothetical protein
MEIREQSEARFVDYHGVYFKMVSDTEFDGTPYCAHCLEKMVFMSAAAPYLCRHCREITPFTVGQLNSVHREIEARLAELAHPVRPVFTQDESQPGGNLR